jgi:L-glutamine:2-deoxy-scyllo-inosose/3-amino-2,3-dideoxy-scyllo-inosose aminotransferase
VSDATHLPAILGGTPARTWAFRTTPEREFDGLEGDFIRTWGRHARSWEPDCPDIGVPVGDGLEYDVAAEAQERFSADIAEALGGEQAAFAAEFAAIHAPNQHAIVVPANNGTRIITDAMAAMTKVTDALGLKPLAVGSEILVPALTWQATAGALLRRNLMPVLVDIDPNTLAMSIDAMQAAITDQTAGILLVHPYHRVAPVAEAMTIASELQIVVGEDAAHAHAARWRGGTAAGTVGHFGTFSFQGSKPLGTGEGGAMITRYANLALQTASTVTCGRQVRDSRRLQADNDRMPGIVAALGRAQLRRFPEQAHTRAATFERLSAAAAELPGVSPLPAQPDVEVYPAYKWPFVVDLDQFGGMTLAQIQRTLERDLKCEVATTYQRLTDSPLYDPHSDPALRINPTYWAGIDPRRYDTPTARWAEEHVLLIEHAAGLDPHFPHAFEQTIHRILDHRTQLARDVETTN